MRGERGWVLLLLAAVFTMHGLQCAGADSGAASGAHGTVHAMAADGPDPVVHLVAPVATIASADHLSAQPLVAAGPLRPSACRSAPTMTPPRTEPGG